MLHFYFKMTIRIWVNTWIQTLVSFATTILSSQKYVWTIFILTQTKYLLPKKKKEKKNTKKWKIWSK